MFDSNTGITLVHCKERPCDVLICRGTPFGNPFTHKQLDKTIAKYQSKTRKESIESFKLWVQTSMDDEAVYIRDHMHELKGKTLGCYCKGSKHPKPCHGEVYIDLLQPDPFEDFLTS